MFAHPEAPSLARPGGVSYLHIRTGDPRATATFYEEVFGWSIRDADADSPAFSDGTGHVIGHFVTDQRVAGESGVRPHIYVEDVSTTAERIAAYGGAILEQPLPRAT